MEIEPGSYLFDASKGNTPLIKVICDVNQFTKDIHMIYEFNWECFHYIKTPKIKIMNYNELLDITYSARFSLGAKYSSTETNYSLIGIFLLLGIFLDEEPCNKCGYLTVLNKIIGSDYERCLNIFRMFGSISLCFNWAKYSNETEANKIIKFYEGKYAWLNYWHRKESTQDLKNSPIYWCEKFALETRRKYEMIMEMYSRNQGDELITSHNTAWLISEFNCFIRALNCNCENINQLYENTRWYINNLTDFSKTPDSYIGEEFFEEVNTLMVSKARTLAENEPDFDKNYFKPWITAYRSSNAYTKKEKFELMGATAPKKRGRKLGQKSKNKGVK